MDNFTNEKPEHDRSKSCITENFLYFRKYPDNRCADYINFKNIKQYGNNKNNRKIQECTSNFQLHPPKCLDKPMVKPGIRDRYDRRTFDLPFWVTYQAGGHPLSSSLFHDGGVLLLIMTYFDIRKARVLAAQGGTITVDKGRVTYPEVNKNKIEYNSFLISDINYIKDDDEENQFKVSLPDKYIVFETKYFASQEDFEEFRSLFN